MAAAFAVARVIQLREGRGALERYAGQIDQAREQFNRENRQAIVDVANDNFPACSDQDLAFMRDYVYHSAHIRDIGRTKDGDLYCSSGTGRLAVPSSPGKLKAFVSGDIKIYPHAPLVFAKKANGFIFQMAGVSVVLNPDSYDYLDQPPMYFSAELLDRSKPELMPAFGHIVPVTAQEAMAGNLLERDGVFYQPICAPNGLLCVVAAEPRADMLSRNRALVGLMVILGALVGGLVGFLIVQFHRGRESMESQLRRALQRGSLTMEYQSIVELETGKIVGAEALARWTNEEGEVVRPEAFVALAELHGFSAEVTRFVVQRSIAEMRDLLQEEGFRLTLNIEALDLADPKFFKHLAATLAAAGVPPSRLGLELTERSTADHKTALDGLEKLKAAGHLVYIDDFGTGYSNLAYLHQLNVHAIKIDRAFTQTVGTGAVTASVVPHILDIAAKLNLLVVVEGIETEEQAAYFRAAGKGILGQGWLFGREMAAPQFRSFFRASRSDR
jgi:sensor c-di-GMP phosphodiesterase-like protein